jgi:hypothetical protein
LGIPGDLLGFAFGFSTTGGTGFGLEGGGVAGLASGWVAAGRGVTGLDSGWVSGWGGVTGFDSGLGSDWGVGGDTSTFTGTLLPQKPQTLDVSGISFPQLGQNICKSPYSMFMGRRIFDMHQPTANCILGLHMLIDP